MSPRLPKELRDKWKADIDATFDARAHRLELERQKAHEDFERWWAEDASDNIDEPPVPPVAKTLPTEEESSDTSLPPPTVSASNSSSGLPNRRTMVLETLPSFRNKAFIRRDVEAKIVEKWPEMEPKTEVDAKNFTSRIAALLTDLVKKGQLSSTEGETSFDPRVYQLKTDYEDTRLKSGP